jgi:hypothetical protein
MKVDQKIMLQTENLELVMHRECEKCDTVKIRVSSLGMLLTPLRSGTFGNTLVIDARF